MVNTICRSAYVHPIVPALMAAHNRTDAPVALAVIDMSFFRVIALFPGWWAVQPCGFNTAVCRKTVELGSRRSGRSGKSGSEGLGLRAMCSSTMCASARCTPEFGPAINNAERKAGIMLQKDVNLSSAVGLPGCLASAPRILPRSGLEETNQSGALCAH